MTVKELAEYYGCGTSTISRRLDKWDLWDNKLEHPEMGFGENPYITRAGLEVLYLEEEMSMDEIAERLSVDRSVIWTRMKKWGIETRERDMFGENNPMFGVERTDETKSRISEANTKWYKNNRHPRKGVSLKEEEIKNMKERAKRENLSEETLKKMRKARIEDLERKHGDSIPNYNEDSIPVIEDFGEKHGYNFQHAENGGEVEVIGYFLDGYDEAQNTVIEYYEPKHKYKRERDRKRKYEIMESLGDDCTFIEIYEDMNITKVNW